MYSKRACVGHWYYTSKCSTGFREDMNGSFHFPLSVYRSFYNPYNPSGFHFLFHHPYIFPILLGTRTLRGR